MKAWLKSLIQTQHYGIGLKLLIKEESYTSGMCRGETLNIPAMLHKTWTRVAIMRVPNISLSKAVNWVSFWKEKKIVTWGWLWEINIKQLQITKPSLPWMSPWNLLCFDYAPHRRYTLTWFRHFRKCLAIRLQSLIVERDFLLGTQCYDHVRLGNSRRLISLKNLFCRPNSLPLSLEPKSFLKAILQ